MNGHIIQPVAHMRDLGVEVDNHPTFDNHIDNIISRAYQRLAILFKGFVSRNPQLLKRAYIVYVRPILEYCSSVWSPYKIRDIEALERVQRYFTRKLYGLKSFTYIERLNILDLESLELRRLEADLIKYFKIMHNHVDVEKSNFFSLAHNSYSTRGHNLKLRKSAFGNNCFENIFANRCVSCWNWLPDEMVNKQSICF